MKASVISVGSARWGLTVLFMHTTADNFHGTVPDYFSEADLNPMPSKGRRADILEFWSEIKPEEKTS